MKKENEKRKKKKENVRTRNISNNTEKVCE